MLSSFGKMNMKNTAQAVVPIAVALLLTLVGCSDGRPDRVPVSGRVLLDGKPLTVGFVRLVPPDARAATGRIGEDGSFHVTTFDTGDGAVTGAHKVAVVAYDENSPGEYRPLIPDKYVRPETSGLEIQIDGPTDDLIIELRSDAGPIGTSRRRQPASASFDSDPTKISNE